MAVYPARIPQAVLVLAGCERELTPEDHARSTVMASREALERQLEPIAPHIHYYHLLTPEQRDKDLVRHALWWARRVGQIWLVYLHALSDDLGSAAYKVLLGNEYSAALPRRSNDPRLLPVHAFIAAPTGVSLETKSKLRRMGRSELRSLLRGNAVAGLLGGNYDDEVEEGEED